MKAKASTTSPRSARAQRPRRAARVRTPTRPDPAAPWMAYAAGVQKGKIPACKWVKLAVERHLRDLKTAKARGFFFDDAAAQHVIDFFTFLRHSKGEWAGREFILAGWQIFILAMLFGWKTLDGRRRFRKSYVEVPRKNGKSTLAAGIGLYLFFADNEPGAEVFTAATKKDQARIVHQEAIRMVRSSPLLRTRIAIFKDNLNIVATNSKFEPLGADQDTMDGLNVHGAVIDELHAHKTRGVFDVLDTATGSRRQSLIFCITTAGFGKVGVCAEMNQHAQQVLMGGREDDAFFCIIFTIDKGDSWLDEKCWAKANPNLGISVKLDDLQKKANTARQMATAQNSFLRLHLNVWTEQAERWIQIEKWDQCFEAFDEASLAGRRCFGALDLSSKLDVTAWELVFPPTEDDEKWRILSRFFVPEESAERRERDANVPYATWARQGHLTLTEGNVVDYDFIKAKVMEDGRVFLITEIAYDRWAATQIALQLQDDGATMVEFGQGYRSMSEPSKEFERLVTSGKMAHNGNPVMTWMVSNVAIEQDPAGNIKPSKRKSTEKIDGVVAVIMGLGRAITQEKEEEFTGEIRSI